MLTKKGSKILCLRVRLDKHQAGFHVFIVRVLLSDRVGSLDEYGDVFAKFFEG